MGFVELSARVAVGVGVAVNVAVTDITVGLGVAIGLTGAVIEIVAVMVEYAGVSWGDMFPVSLSEGVTIAAESTLGDMKWGMDKRINAPMSGSASRVTLGDLGLRTWVAEVLLFINGVINSRGRPGL